MIGQTNNKGKKTFLHRIRKFIVGIGIFVILVILPTITIWISLYYYQQYNLEDSRNEALEEMAELTAHMLRRAEPETFFQEALRDLSEKFKWEKLEDIPRLSNKSLLELALFDENGKRLKWPNNESLTKIKPSQNYLVALKRFAANPGTTPTAAERSIAIGYSGNEITLSSLAASPNNLVNFQGIGLRKMGGWYKVQLKHNDKDNQQNDSSIIAEPNYKRVGDLIAWLNLEKLDKYSLANQTINYMQKRLGPEFTFSYIDLKQNTINKCSYGRRFKPEIIEILSSNNLKSGFILKDELFSINDTQEGIRLICSRPSPKPLSFIKNYNRFLILFIPTFVLLFIWINSFKIRFNISYKTEAAYIFTFSSIIGVICILIGTLSYQYEKQISLTQNYKNEAIEILEKIDQQYSDSFDDLLFQYRNFKKELSFAKKNPNEILAPLVKAQKDNLISYAVYVNKFGEVVFQAPNSTEANNSIGLADRYSKLINRVAKHCIQTYNSSIIKPENDPDTMSAQNITLSAVESLLSGRSKFIETKLDNEDTLAFMDFVIDNKENIANGCLLIIHEPRLLEMNYLAETGLNLNKLKDFELIAFPKKISDQKSYYPKYSYINEEPLWKLNDMVNQTQLASFKKGRLAGKLVIIAALPANQMKNYNLFLAIPVEKIADKSFSLSKLLLIGTAFSLIFIIITGVIISNSLSKPINTLKANVDNIREIKNEYYSNLSLTGSEDIDNISSGVTNLVLKTKEFVSNKNLLNSLSPFNTIIANDYYIDSLLDNNRYNYISYASTLDDNNIFIFYIKDISTRVLNSSLNSVMEATLLKILSETIGVRSPYICIKNLEEYFRINYKQNLEGSIIAMFLNTETNILTYSFLGNIKLLKYNSEEDKCELVTNSEISKNANEQKYSDNEYQISGNSTVVVFSDDYSEETINNFKKNIPNFKDKNSITEYSNNSINSDKLSNFVVIHKNINNSINKKLAETNPIAYIRSQNNEGKTNA